MDVSVAFPGVLRFVFSVLLWVSLWVSSVFFAGVGFGFRVRLWG